MRTSLSVPCYLNHLQYWSHTLQVNLLPIIQKCIINIKVYILSILWLASLHYWILKLFQTLLFCFVACWWFDPNFFEKLGGLLFKPGGSNLQHATTISFLFLVYAGYLKQTNKEINCGGKVFASPKRLKQIERGQVCKF